VLHEATVSGNTATGTGGGVATSGNVITTLVVDSTISGNAAARGGGAGVWGWGNIEVRNSTISGNSASSGLGAALWLEDGGIGVTASTITHHPGLAILDWSTSLINLSGSLVNDSCGSDTRSEGHNLTTAGCPLTRVGDRQVGDLGLGPLADNGGPTRTHLPNAGSPAIDAVPILAPWLCAGTEDQRGVSRPQGAACDNGAVEQQRPALRSAAEKSRGRVNPAGSLRRLYGHGGCELDRPSSGSTWPRSL
jgi:predicted outer membrane repeat protein